VPYSTSGKGTPVHVLQEFYGGPRPPRLPERDRQKARVTFPSGGRILGRLLYPVFLAFGFAAILYQQVWPRALFRLLDRR